MSAESIKLSFTEGSSDKAYHASLEPSGDGFLVNFAYGRRCGPYKTGTKTPKPLPYDQAKRAYDKLVQEKMAKGYTTDGSGTPFVGSTVTAERTGFLPQLLNPIEPEDIPGALSRASGELFLQTKHDGERRIVVINKNEVYGSNRKGLKVALPTNIVESLADFLATQSFDQLVLDTEDMGSHLVVFDILQWGQDFSQRTFRTRSSYLPLLKPVEYLYVDTPVAAFDPSHVFHFLELAQESNEEGIVLRDPEAQYTPGRPNSWGPCLKIKLYATATCKVGAIHPTKRSISLELFSVAAQTREHPFGDWVYVGNCTIPPNYPMPSIGELVEIKYLYAYRGGSLYQPQYKGVRTDLEFEDANISQLKFKE